MAVLFSTVLMAQDVDCNEYVKREYDEVTGRTTIYSADILYINGNELMLPLFIHGGDVIMFSLSVSSKSVHCIDKHIVNILFDDGERLELMHQGKYNCKGRFNYFFHTAKENPELMLLCTKTIKTIRVNNSGNYIEHTLTEKEKNTLMNTFNCFNNL